MKKIWLLTNNVVGGWETYDSCVVVADTEVEARKVKPEYATIGSSWCRPDEVIVEYVGTTDREFPNNVICVSFNAG